MLLLNLASASEANIYKARGVLFRLLARSLWDGMGAYDKVIGHGIGLAPGRHDVGVVEGNDDDVVDALCPEPGLVVEVRRQVRGLAGRREGAGDGDEDDLFGLELCGASATAPEKLQRRDRTEPLLASYCCGMPHTLMSPSADGGM